MTELIYKKDKQNLAYLKQGEGAQRLVFIHGLCGRKEFWAQQFDFFSSDYEVIAVDLLGHGRSSKVRAADMITSSTSIIRSFLVAQLPAPTILIGHSVGGWIINEISRDHDNVLGCVFVDSSCLTSSAEIFENHGAGADIMKAENPRAFITEWFQQYVTENCDTDIRRMIVDETQKFDPAWLAEFMLNAKAQTAPRWNGKALIAEGEQYFPEGTTYSWRKFFPDATSVKYPGRGHFFFIEDPHFFNRELKSFIDARMKR